MTLFAGLLGSGKSFVKLGINTFLFAAPFTNTSTRLFSRFSRWGFESVELPIEDFSQLDPAFVKRELDRHGLVCCAVTPCLGPERDLRGTLQQQRNALEFMQKAIDFLEPLNAGKLVGVVYSTVGRADAVPREEYRRQWKTVVKNLRQLCDYAEGRGRQIALEPINRFETDFVNTCEQGLNLIADVGSPVLKLQLDTFHMNIEEKNQAAAIRRAGGLLGHFHACGSDRGTPGKDHIDWKGITAALESISYSGDVVIESFTTDVKVIARAASIWRKIEPTRDEIAADGAKFLRTLFNQSHQETYDER